MQILQWFSEPHTYREMIEKFGEEKHWVMQTLKRQGAIAIAGLVRGHDRMVYCYKATGVQYVNQKTRKFYGI
jgi:hypothetical protein